MDPIDGLAPVAMTNHPISHPLVRALITLACLGIFLALLIPDLGRVWRFLSR